MSKSGVSQKDGVRLALASGNQCAFPGCGSLLWYADRDLLLGEICHIKGRNPGAKRYDPGQTDEERNAFGNLIFLCTNHHTEVDNDELAHTVEGLRRMKRDHEASVAPVTDVPDSIVGRLVGSVGPVSVYGDRNVTSVGQMGGQTAWSILNEGPQPRRISRAAGEALVAELRRYPPERFQISSMSDAESGELGETLQGLLEAAGWRLEMLVSGAMLNRSFRGVAIETALDTEAIDALAGWMEKAGLSPQVNRGPERFGILKMRPIPVHVVVGVLPR